MWFTKTCSNDDNDDKNKLQNSLVKTIFQSYKTYVKLRTCLGALKLTPIEALQVEALEPPLYLEGEYSAEETVIKIADKRSPLLKNINMLNSLLIQH